MKVANFFDTLLNLVIVGVAMLMVVLMVYAVANYSEIRETNKKNRFQIVCIDGTSYIDDTRQAVPLVPHYNTDGTIKGCE